MFENLVISETTYELLFQESEPVYVLEQGVFGDDRQQDHDTNSTGYPLWMVRVTASNEANREEQVLEVQVAAPDQPTANFKEKVLLPTFGSRCIPAKQRRTSPPAGTPTHSPPPTALYRRHSQKGARQATSRSSGLTNKPATATGANRNARKRSRGSNPRVASNPKEEV